MFGAVKRLANNLSSIDKNKMIGDIISIPSVQSQIIDLNQNQLYEQGVDAAGDPTGDYAYSTINGTSEYEGKIQKGQRYDHITLNDTGEFYNSMKVIQGSEAFAIIGKLPGSARDRWPDALGLTTESKAEIIPEIRERLVDALIKKALK
jgi:hypothetical protein